MTGQSHQALRVVRNRLKNGPVKTDPNRELDEHRPQTPQGVHTVFLVEFHGFLRNPLPVVLKFGLNLLHQWLKLVHLLDLAALFHSQWNHHQPDQKGKRNNGNTKI